MADIMETVDILEEPDTTEKESTPEFEVSHPSNTTPPQVSEITSRREVDDDHLYEVHWKDGDITWEPVSNLGGASEALRQYLLTNHPDDRLLKLLSSLADSSDEENEAENGVDKKLGWLARWHQKTTRGSTQYWLRKGEHEVGEVPRLLNPDVIDHAPLEPREVPADTRRHRRLHRRHEKRLHFISKTCSLNRTTYFPPFT
eukprot:sb/3470643/